MPSSFYDKPDDDVELIKLGEQLRDLREAQGLSYEDVSNMTHVRPHILKAIEEGRVHDFAAPVYARGFTKTYCGCLMADDLWKKYIQHLPSKDAPKIKKGMLHATAVNHPTPMFRRSSIIWVYIILIFAVFAAAFLLWNQHSRPGRPDNGFFLKNSGTDNGGTLPVISRDETLFAEMENIRAVSEDLSREIHSPAASSPDLPLPGAERVDLSWLDGEQPQRPPDTEISVVLPQIPMNRVLIEVQKPARLIVSQRGTVVTRRSMPAGGVRSYDVTGDTPVSLSVGNAADVTWYGKKYSPVGSSAGPLSLIFHPDGRVTVTEGSSAHFRNAR